MDSVTTRSRKAGKVSANRPEERVLKGQRLAEALLATLCFSQPTRREGTERCFALRHNPCASGFSQPTRREGTESSRRSTYYAKC